MGLFVGYKNNGTTYRILPLQDMTLVPTRHARFSELVFPGLGSPPSPLDEGLDFDEDKFFDCIESAGPSHSAAPLLPAIVASPKNSTSGNSSPPVFVTSRLTPPPEPIAPPAPAAERPRHEIIGDVCPANIISGPRRPCAYIMTAKENTPAHYHQSVSGPDGPLWKAAIDKELNAMALLGVWGVVKLSSDIKTVGTTWVFRIKHSPPNGACQLIYCTL
jgi:hypothetical protein